MIAFPVKTDKKNAAINPSFCKTKFFAFFDGNDVVIEKNEQTCGGKIVKWLASKGVDKVVLRDIGGSPYRQAKNHNIALYYAGDDRIEIPELVAKIKNNELIQMDEVKIAEVVSKHESKHHKDGEHGHGHSHNHDHEVFQRNPLQPISNNGRFNFGEKRGN